MARSADIDMDTRRRLAAWLRYYKAVRGLTNEALADLLGLAEPTVTNILNDRRTAGLEVLTKMHRAFYIRADELLDTDPPPIPGDAAKRPA